MIDTIRESARKPIQSLPRLAILAGAVLLFMLVLVWGCGSKEEPPPVKSNKVTKPAQAPVKAATAQPVGQAQQAAKAEEAQQTKQTAQVEETPAEAKPETASAEQKDAGQEESVAMVSKDSQLLKIWEAETKKYTFNPIGRSDPFMPIVWERSEREKRVPLPTGKPLTPLQKVPLSSIRLIAVISPKSGEAMAMVEDPTGMGYIVKKGAAIGLNNGQIIGIFQSEDVVEDGMIKTVKPARILIKEQYKYFNTTRINIEEIQIKGEK